MEALAQRADSIKITNEEIENQQNRTQKNGTQNRTENGTQNESELHEIDEGDILRQFHCDIDSVEELMAEGNVHRGFIVINRGNDYRDMINGLTGKRPTVNEQKAMKDRSSSFTETLMNHFDKLSRSLNSESEDGRTDITPNYPDDPPNPASTDEMA